MGRPRHNCTDCNLHPHGLAGSYNIFPSAVRPYIERDLRAGGEAIANMSDEAIAVGGAGAAVGAVLAPEASVPLGIASALADAYGTYKALENNDYGEAAAQASPSLVTPLSGKAGAALSVFNAARAICP